jgi:quinoprotein glucose dehydrogenase
MHPAIGDVTLGGKRVQAVIIANKTNFVYALDRRTGRPLWPIEERPVGQATTKNGERTSPMQPFPTKPPAIGLQGSVPDNLIDVTPALKARALEHLKQLEHGPLFTPPSDGGTLVVPSENGGPNLGGAAFDPETGVYYVPTRFTQAIHRAGYPNAPGAPAGENAGPDRRRTDPALTLDGLPLFKPPYASVAAVDMNRGEIRWQTPIGNGPRTHPLLAGLTLPPLGDAIQGAGPLVTRTLLFVAVTNLFGTGQPAPAAFAKFGDAGWERKLLYVLDKTSGAVVHVIEMDGLAMSTPMTYLHGGRQYLVVAMGSREQSELVAFALPDPGRRPSAGY